MLIKEMIENAKEGNEFCKEYLYEKYYYIVRKVYEKYQDKISLHDILKIYNDLLNKYLEKDFALSISVYILSGLEKTMKNEFSEEKELITDLIREAKTGNCESRNKLINHYTYIVERIAKKHNYMEYDDLVQCGLIKLITFIDNKLLNGDGSLFTSELIKTLERYYNATLRKEAESNKNQYKYIYKTSDEIFLENTFEIELIDSINSKKITEKDKLCALKYFIEKLSISKIGDIHHCSKQAVSKRIQKVVKKLEQDYIK